MATDKKVRVKINPLHNIGGYGRAGDVVMMPVSEAKKYEADGYVTLMPEPDAGPVVGSQAAEQQLELAPEPAPEPLETNNDDEVKE